MAARDLSVFEDPQWQAADAAWRTVQQLAAWQAAFVQAWASWASGDGLDASTEAQRHAWHGVLALASGDGAAMEAIAEEMVRAQDDWARHGPDPVTA